MTTHTPADRLPDVVEPDRVFPMGFDDRRICYWRQAGEWWIYLPYVGAGRLIKHRVEEHADGTITVSPSILLATLTRRRHGFLKHGVWEACSDDYVPPAEEV